MYKTLALLGLPAVVIFVFVWANELDTISLPTSSETSVTTNLLQNQETLGVSTDQFNRLEGWIPQTDSNIGIRFKTPENITVEKNSDGMLEVKSGDLNLLFSRETLDEKETVNTIAEKHIDAKTQNLGDRYKLTDIISPVAIGGVTGIAYTDVVDGREVTYFFVPAGQEYIYIENSTDATDSEKISTADNIIYSLELLQP